MTDYDAVIIGSGTAGQTAAYALRAKGLNNAAGLINTLRLAMLNRIPAASLYHQSVVSPYPSRESDLLYMLKPFTTLT